MSSAERRPGRALVIWADSLSTNLGVRVLAEGNRSLAVLATDVHDVDFQSYGAGPAPRPIGLRSLLLAWLRIDPAISRWLRGYSYVIDSGAGDSFTDIYGHRRLLEMSLLRCLVVRNGIPLVLGPQTVGPFDSVLGRVLARVSTRKARLVLARDSTSAAAAATFGIKNVHLATDTVFALPAAQTTGSARAPRTLLNVSGLLWFANGHVSSATYRQAVLGTAEALVGRGLQVVLLAHVLDSPDADNDVRAIKEAVAELAARGLQLDVCVPTSLEQVRAEIADSELVVAARMHACLNALSLGTPSIAWAYSRKFKPLLEDLGWTAVVDLDRSAQEIVEVTMQEALTTTSSDLAVHGVRTNAEERLASAVRRLRAVLPHD